MPSFIFYVKEISKEIFSGLWSIHGYFELATLRLKRILWTQAILFDEFCLASYV